MVRKRVQAQQVAFLMVFCSSQPIDQDPAAVGQAKDQQQQSLSSDAPRLSRQSFLAFTKLAFPYSEDADTM